MLRRAANSRRRARTHETVPSQTDRLSGDGPCGDAPAEKNAESHGQPADVRGHHPVARHLVHTGEQSSRTATGTRIEMPCSRVQTVTDPVSQGSHSNRHRCYSDKHRGAAPDRRWPYHLPQRPSVDYRKRIRTAEHARSRNEQEVRTSQTTF
jgi:hypothetical protein